jgi:hypothetical protein
MSIDWDVIRIESVLLASVEPRTPHSHPRTDVLTAATDVAAATSLAATAPVTSNTQVQLADVTGKTCVQLRFMCRQRGMYQDGPRTTLVKRLLTNDRETRMQRRVRRSAEKAARDRTVAVTTDEDPPLLSKEERRLIVLHNQCGGTWGPSGWPEKGSRVRPRDSDAETREEDKLFYDTVDRWALDLPLPL